MILSFFALESPFALSSFFFFNDTATTEIYTLSLHDALPIYVGEQRDDQARADCGAVDRRHHRLVEVDRSEEHTSELQSLAYLVCRLLLEKKKRLTCSLVERNHFMNVQAAFARSFPLSNRTQF